MRAASQRRHGHAIITVLVSLVLLATACGARLTDEQRAAGIGAFAGGGGTSTDDPLLGGADGVTGGDNGSTDGGPVDVGGSGGGTSTGGDVGTDEPAGGNGGATDVGVTGDKLTIATIADVSGVQPGLFKAAHQAMQALVAMVNSEGGIYGRQLELLLLDSKTDAGANRTAVLDACPKAFALVGSVSAFDNGGAEAVDACGKEGIPDISAVTTTGPRILNQDTYPAYPNRPDLFVVGSGDYMAKRFPDAVKKAGRLWLAASTTRSNSEAKAEAYSGKSKFNFIYEAETGVVETNYTPYVQKMEDRGVEFVTMLSDYQSIARLTKAMRSQQYTPAVMEWDSVVYSQKFLEEAEGAAEGSWLYLNTAMFEESQNYPEMQLYQAWLARVAPGVPPDYFGLYAWSAGRLFVELAKEVGPQATRAKLFDALKNEHSWDGFGLHASHDIGRKRASNCTMFARIKDNQFVRAYPKSGFNCSSPLYPTSVR